MPAAGISTLKEAEVWAVEGRRGRRGCVSVRVSHVPLPEGRRGERWQW